ncbi:MAG: hypothetical protein G01um101470_56 [Parcubacteria group bacterium Gr01-1014_70]|nr:MAG: hypothetical protein G01um101470_56 [Parcubacteria group bacterium Gr01-1014_70]
MKKTVGILGLVLLSLTCAAPKKQEKTIALIPPAKPAEEKIIREPKPQDNIQPPIDEKGKKTTFVHYTISANWHKENEVDYMCTVAGYYSHPELKHAEWFEIRRISYLGGGKISKERGKLIKEGPLSRQICAQAATQNITKK